VKASTIYDAILQAFLTQDLDILGSNSSLARYCGISFVDT